MPELRFVPIADIKAGERFRKDYGDLKELAESIRVKGIVQPLTLDTDLNLVAGGRRLSAARMLNLESVPALIRENLDEVDPLEVELIENIQRKDMTWQERVNLTNAIDAYYKKKDQNWSGRKTAEAIGKSIGGVSRHLQLAEAIEVAPQLAECKTEDDAFKLLKNAQKRVTIRKLREEQEARMANIPMVKHAQSHFKIGDALAGMEELAEMYERGGGSQIGLIECDPPYGIDLNTIKKGDEKHADYEEISKDDYPDWLEGLCKLLYRCSAANSWTIFWFGPTWFTETKRALLLAGFKVDDIPGIWNKGSGQTNCPELYLARTYEPFFIARKGSPQINKQGRANIFNFSPLPPGDKWHPTQRPLSLIEEILETFALPGTVCMSPFLGSGTTLMACYNQKMACFGWDKNEKAKDRFLIEVEERYREQLVNEVVR